MNYKSIYIYTNFQIVFKESEDELSSIIITLLV